jgi:hypothetical protein
MTDIEQKARDMVRKEGQYGLLSFDAAIEALCRAIEQHEAFKQEVSDAVQSWVDGGIDRPAYLWFRKKLEQFIIRKPDPLVEVIKAMQAEPTTYVTSEVYANRIHKKLDDLGFEIREKGQ